MSISEEQVRHVARLARLQLEPNEMERMTRELGRVLDYVVKLNELNTDRVEPTMHVIPVVTALRGDETRASLPVSQVLKNAPDARENMFEVPRIMDGGES